METDFNHKLHIDRDELRNFVPLTDYSLPAKNME